MNDQELNTKLNDRIKAMSAPKFRLSHLVGIVFIFAAIACLIAPIFLISAWGWLSLVGAPSCWVAAIVLLGVGGSLLD
jgi:hypothetical protein